MTLMLRDTSETFGTPSRLLHWAGALAIAAAWIVGTVMSDLPRGPSKAAGLDLHFALGSLVLTLSALRLIWRLFNPRPESPPGTPPWQEYAAHLGHLALYVLMFALPFTGVLAAWFGGKTINLLWLVSLPSPWPRD